jgi:hypothetical protein
MQEKPDAAPFRVSAADLDEVEDAYVRRFHRQSTLALVTRPPEGTGPEHQACYEALTRELDELDVLFAPFLVVEFTGLKEAESFAAAAPEGLVSLFHRGKRRPGLRAR